MPFVIDKFKSKNGASVSEEFALFNWSSEAQIAVFQASLIFQEVFQYSIRD